MPEAAHCVSDAAAGVRWAGVEQLVVAWDPERHLHLSGRSGSFVCCVVAIDHLFGVGCQDTCSVGTSVVCRWIGEHDRMEGMYSSIIEAAGMR